MRSSAVTTTDANAVTDAYNAAFFVLSGSNGTYKNDTTGGGFGFWTGAEEIEMMEDAYERSKNPNYLTMVTQLINGFVNKNGSLWTGNGFNDDILWATIASARAYQLTGNTTFKTLAKNNFDAVYARAYDTTLGGGLWWSTAKSSKNSCVNGPGEIAACLLYTILNDSSYLTKAQSLYSWERSTLFNASTGSVYDHINADGTLSTVALTYNEGTFLGAGNYLYGITGTASYLSDAQLCASYTQAHLCDSNGILPQYSSTGDLSGFNGIFIRWLGHMAKQQNLWANYYDWMATNAAAALGSRRSDGLAWDQWKTATPTGTLQSWACSNTVVICNVCPAQFEVENLTLQATSGATYRVFTDTNLSGGAGGILDGTAVGNSFTVVVPDLAAGKYELILGVKKINTRGIYQLAIGQAGNNSPTLTGSPTDLYSASTAYDEIDVGTWTPGTTTDKWFWFTLTGKNAASTGYTEAFDYIRLLPKQ